MDIRRSVDKHPVCDFLPNIVIHNILSICNRMAGRGTWDPRRGLKLSYLVSSSIIQIRRAGLSCCMMRAKRRACTDIGPIE